MIDEKPALFALMLTPIISVIVLINSLTGMNSKEIDYTSNYDVYPRTTVILPTPTPEPTVAPIITPAPTEAPTPLPQPVVTPEPYVAPPVVPQTEIEKLVCSYSWNCGYALKIMYCESGGVPTSVGNGEDYGLFQINVVHERHWGDFWQNWMKPERNVQWAYEIWSARGWKPWACRWYV